MKKTFSIIALFMVCFLIIPSVPCYASDSTFQLKTSLSVAGFYNDQNIDTYSSNFINYNGDYISNYYDALDSLNVDSSLTPFLVARFFRSGSNITSYRLYVFCYNNNYEINDINIVSTGGLDSLGAVGTCYMFVDFNNSLVDSSDWLIKGYECVFQSDGSFSWNNVSNILQVNYMSGNKIKYTFNSSFTSFIDCDYSCFANNEIISSGVGNVTSSISAGDYFNYDRSSLHDLLSIDMPYVDSSGNTITPAPDVQIESNSNHMYFQNCDLGFCEPTDIKNFTSFGGAYLYCKYTLDNWVINHINDYQLQFNVVAAIGSEQNNFSYTMRVDRNGFVTIPFSYLFQSQSSSAIPINRGFAAVVTNQKLGSDYNIAHLYSVANSNVPNFIRTLGAEYNYNLTDLGWSALKGGTLKYLCAWVSDGGTISMNNLAEWSENVAQSFNPYILRVNVKLVSGDDVSGDYAEKFDLYAGDQSTVDTGGLVNNDPFVPDVDQDDGDLPELPQDPNSTTPSTIVYTGGTFTGNFNGVIGYDPGYRDLKADLDADPDDNFTQYLAPFKNNEVGGFVGDFLDDMPTALKSIFIGGFGVLTLLGIYRFIRRG